MSTTMGYGQLKFSNNVQQISVYVYAPEHNTKHTFTRDHNQLDDLSNFLLRRLISHNSFSSALLVIHSDRYFLAWQTVLSPCTTSLRRRTWPTSPKRRTATDSWSTWSTPPATSTSRLRSQPLSVWLTVPLSLLTVSAVSVEWYSDVCGFLGESTLNFKLGFAFSFSYTSCWVVGMVQNDKGHWLICELLGSDV